MRYIFWKMVYGEKDLPGWQIMDENMENPVLYDADGNVLKGGFDYTVTGVSEAPPAWWKV
jgi:hypothetical protein